MTLVWWSASEYTLSWPHSDFSGGKSVTCVMWIMSAGKKALPLDMKGYVNARLDTTASWNAFSTSLTLPIAQSNKIWAKL